MNFGDLDGTSVRGADGLLYNIASNSREPIVVRNRETPAVRTANPIRSSTRGLDHAAARNVIDPGDSLSVRNVIDPGDSLSARNVIDPGDSLSARNTVDPGDSLSARNTIDPGDSLSARNTVDPGDSLSARQMNFLG